MSTINSPKTTPTVAADVAARIRGLIRSGELGMGDRLPAERELSAQLGVARISVREAIRQLTEAGYTVVRRGAQGGAFVTALDEPYRGWLDEMREQAGELDAILDLRIAVESHVAYLAARRHVKADLRPLFESLDDIADAGDNAAFRFVDSQFHSNLAVAAHSPRLEAAVLHARGEFFTPIDTLVWSAIIDASVAGHTAVLEAVAARDAEGARHAMIEHIEQTRRHTRARLKK